MVEQEQIRPLAPASDRTSSDDEEAAVHQKKIRRRKCLKCCGITAVILLIPIIVIIILFFTVFKIKDPHIRLNGVTVTHLELINNTNIPKPGTNMSVIADVSVKNPNIASFKYQNTTTALYYHGDQIGEAKGPPGKAKARRTLRMNVTVDVITDKLINNTILNTEVGKGIISIDSYSKIGGRVKILKIIKKHVTVKMNCSFVVNITSQQIQSQKCKQKVDL